MDFTKEELEHLEFCADHVLESCSSGSVEGITTENIINQSKLIAKIKSMINKCCDCEKTYHCDYCGIISCEHCRQPVGGELFDD